MSPDEKEVREAWQAEVAFEDHRLCCGEALWRWVIDNVASGWADTESAAIAAAAAFTRQRREEIGKLEEEIELVQCVIVPGQPVFPRILARLEAILADLKRGWKGGS